MSVVDRIMVPQICPYVHILIPRTSGYVTFHGKREFVDIFKLSTLRWGDYPRLSGWVQWNHKGSQNWKKETEDVWGRCDSWRLDRKMQNFWFWTQRKETTSQGRWAASRGWKRQRNGFSPWTSRKECSPADTC